MKHKYSRAIALGDFTRVRSRSVRSAKSLFFICDAKYPVITTISYFCNSFIQNFLY
ncbi:hypothetical protein [Synechocystis sp. PCC 7509]|uniref:hypothetical protein n=1 Tax=Synechocystis sp. PCC 7509 TaxID=927677 RepID=UPI00030E147B|nr:hypothetical protein [Synechocystis sp. PCC 7509]